MDSTTNTAHITEGGKLRIWQQNANASLISQQDLLKTIGKNDYDICAIQEPYLDSMHRTRANPYWVVVYPSTHMVEPKKTRTVILVNKRISTDRWEGLEIDTGDVTGIRLKTETNIIDLYNIYNDNTNCDALDKVGRAADTYTDQSPEHQQIWLGDFNCHHPMWD